MMKRKIQLRKEELREEAESRFFSMPGAIAIPIPDPLLRKLVEVHPDRMYTDYGRL